MIKDRLMFGLMYLIGFTPWEGHKLPTRLRDLVEGKYVLPKGKALDLGCGTGDTSIYLAQNGWDVTAIDFVQRAVKRAQTKAAAAGVKVRYHPGGCHQAELIRSGDGLSVGFTFCGVHSRKWQAGTSVRRLQLFLTSRCLCRRLQSKERCYRSVH